MDKKEAKQRKRRADQDRLTPEQRDRATLRTNVILVALGVVVVVADIAYLVLNPGLKAAYLGPLAGLLGLRLSMAWVTIKRTRARLKERSSHART